MGNKNLHNAKVAKNDEFYIRLFQNLFNIDVCNSCTCKVA